MEARQKTSLAMTERTRIKLEELRLRLQKAGLSPSACTKAAILEALVAQADFDRLLDKLTR